MLLANWWLAPLLHDGFRIPGSLQIASEAAGGNWVPAPPLEAVLPMLSSGETVQLLLTVGLVEMAYSLYMTRRLAAAGERDFGGDPMLGLWDEVGQLGPLGRGWSASAGGISVAASLSGALQLMREQELSVGRVSMLLILSSIVQSAVSSYLELGGHT
jgi:hypothetical protein